MWNKGKRYRVNETKSRKNRIKQLFFITILIVTVFGIVSILIISSILDSQLSNTDAGISIRPVESHSVATAVGTTIDTSAPSKDISENSTQLSAATTSTTLATTQVLTTEPTEKQAEKSWLVDIDNPDYDYNPPTIFLTDDDRELIAKTVMREFGDGGYTACCLQAQAFRDAMVYSHASAEYTYQYFQYDAYPLVEVPSSECYAAVDFIFGGNMAVPHRVLCMYSPEYVYSAWHESQTFVVEYNGIRFFDLAE